MADPSIEVSEESRDAAQILKSKAIDAVSQGKLNEANQAIDQLTEAILLNSSSAILYATRASIFVKLRKPNAATQDADAALQINPDSAKGYKTRGMARAMLGLWEEAACDLGQPRLWIMMKRLDRFLKRLNPMSTKLKSISGSMSGYKQKGNSKQWNVRGNSGKLKPRWPTKRTRRRNIHLKLVPQFSLTARDKQSTLFLFLTIPELQRLRTWILRLKRVKSLAFTKLVIWSKFQCCVTGVPAGHSLLHSDMVWALQLHGCCLHKLGLKALESSILEDRHR